LTHHLQIHGAALALHAEAWKGILLVFPSRIKERPSVSPGRSWEEA